MDDDLTQVTYVLEQIEVRPTGRTAEQKLSSGRVETSHEVAPVEPLTGMGKKWVNLSKLPRVQA